MDEKEKGEKAIRANVSNAADANIGKTQAEEQLGGNKMTREETINYMLTNFKNKKKASA